VGVGVGVGQCAPEADTASRADQLLQRRARPATAWPAPQKTSQPRPTSNSDESRPQVISGTDTSSPAPSLPALPPPASLLRRRCCSSSAASGSALRQPGGSIAPPLMPLPPADPGRGPAAPPPTRGLPGGAAARPARGDGAPAQCGGGGTRGLAPPLPKAPEPCLPRTVRVVAPVPAPGPVKNGWNAPLELRGGPGRPSGRSGPCGRALSRGHVVGWPSGAAQAEAGKDRAAKRRLVASRRSRPAEILKPPICRPPKRAWIRKQSGPVKGSKTAARARRRAPHLQTE
jgi:hypothetical protein